MKKFKLEDLDAGLKDKLEPKKLRVFKDPKGHNIEISIKGHYESALFYCDKCKSFYLLTKSEIEEL